MLSEQLQAFKESPRTFTAREIAEAYEEIRERLMNRWSTSLSADGDGREELYRQLRGLDAIIDELVAGWSKE